MRLASALLIAALLLIAAAGRTAAAQTELTLPWPSPAASISQSVGTSTVAIDYHRPGVKGRKIWGELVPYGDVWRTGANEATVIKLSHAAKVAGHEVPAGSYAFFAIPQKETWTLILNKQDKQWGSFFYDVKQDLVRFDVKPELAPSTEWMTYAIDPTGKASANVRLQWEKLAISFPVEFDVQAIVLKDIDDALARAKPDEWTVYFQAAKYYNENELAPDKAMAWVDKAMSMKESFWIYELKAKMLHKRGETAAAIPLLEKAIELSSASAPKGYVDGLRNVLAEYRAATTK